MLLTEYLVTLDEPNQATVKRESTLLASFQK